MIKGAIQGAFAYLKAIRLVAKHNLWFYVLVPGLLSLLLGGALFSAAWGISDDIGGWLIAFYPFEWGKNILAGVAQAFGGLVVLALGLIVFKYVILIVASPVMSILSEKAERILSGQPSTHPFTLAQMTKDVIRGMRIALRNILRELFLTVVLLIVGLVLPPLSPVTTVGIFLVQAFYAGFGNMDYTLERRYSVADSVAYVKQNRGLAVGNGAVFLLLLFTVVGFLVALPLGTVAAVVEMEDGKV